MFFISILLVCLSSYLILSLINKEKSNPVSNIRDLSQKNTIRTDFLYLFLISFSQIVFSFEVLSLLKSISAIGILICNLVFFILSLSIFVLKKGKLYLPELTLKRLFVSMKKDKSLVFLGVCFVLFCIFQLITIFAFPVKFGDALIYYLTRCTMWIQQGSISHFFTPDSRELIMPVNMDLLYTWVLIFRKSIKGIAIFSFTGFLIAIYSLYNLLRELKFSIQRSLWSIFVFSSFALVIVEIISPIADLFIGALILASIYLFILAIKGDKKALFFSSLAYALAVGTKTTAIIAIPSVFLIFVFISILKKQKNFSTLKYFSLLFIINFIIFSSYNYILNYIEFSNAFSSNEEYLVHQFNGGIKGYITNLIKYCFIIFDTSGMPFDISALINKMQAFVLSLFNSNAKIGTSEYFPCCFEFNGKMNLVNTALGIMGLFVFLPSLIFAIKRFIKNKYSKSAFITGILAFSIIFNLLLFSRVMVFAGYNMRYLLTFVIIASPVIAYSYPVKHSILKKFLCFIIFIYLVGTVHIKPVSYIFTCLKEQKLVKVILNDEELSVYQYFIDKKPSNIALMASWNESPLFFIQQLSLYGFHIEKISAENIEDFKLNKFDYIITNKNKVSTGAIYNFEKRMKNPKAFVSRCLYNDSNQNTIYNLNTNVKPATAECEIPFAYLYKKGFINDINYKGDKYIILYNTKKEI